MGILGLMEGFENPKNHGVFHGAVSKGLFLGRVWGLGDGLGGWHVWILLEGLIFLRRAMEG